MRYLLSQQFVCLLIGVSTVVSMTLVYVALAWCGGMVFAAAHPDFSPSGWLIAVLTGIAFLIGLVALRRVKQTPRHMGVLLLIALLGGLRFSLAPTSSPIAGYANGSGATLEGVVTAPPESREDRYQIRLAVESVYQASRTAAAEGLVLVNAPRYPAVHYGDRIAATGILIAPSRYGNFSYADYLARGGVYALLQDASIEVSAPSVLDIPFAVLMSLREQAAEHIARALPEPEAGLLTGILLGDDSSLADSVSGAFAATGTAHVIAISGFNMVVISGIVSALMERLRIRKGRAAFLSLVVVAAYTVFVGASAGVVRAALMSGLLIVGCSLRRRAYVPASLAFAALLISFVTPSALWDVGFQLSFAAVVGIAVFADPMMRWFDRGMHRLLPRRAADPLVAFLNEPLVVSAAATAATLPLTMLYFGQVSLVTLIVNVLIIPVQPLVLMLGGAAIIVSFVAAPLAGILFAGVFLVLAYTIDLVRIFAGLSFAQQQVSLHPSLVAVGFSAVVFGAILQAKRPAWAKRVWSGLKQRRLVSMIALVLIAALVLGIAYLRAQPDGLLHIWILDMGHANAALIQTPDGAHVLIDGGRYPTRLLTLLGDRLPFYKRDIDLLAISNPDPNTYTALSEVARRYTIGAAITNGQPNLNPVYADLLNVIGAEHVIAAHNGTAFDLSDGVRVEVLNPLEAPAMGDSFGSTSLVIRIRFGSTAILFPSDLSASAQLNLLDAGIDVRASMMVLPQHGRERSLEPDFLTAVNPAVVLLQYDPANRSGDPAPGTLDQLEGRILYRTDEGGTIHLMTDGVNLWQTYETDG
ncbi:MAG: ComEC/Rec2 family competence protein [Anaerolineae bacterium]